MERHPATTAVSDVETLLFSWGSFGSTDIHLLLLLSLSAGGSLLVFGLAVAAYRRRRSRPYLLITAALGALVTRPIVGASSLFGLLSMQTHHTIEHLLDVVIAGLLIAAIYSVGHLEHDSRPQVQDGGVDRESENDQQTS